jgi:hypothetical protein
MSFKTLTSENWTERDPVNNYFHDIDVERGAARQLSGDDWARQFLAVQLDARVPDDAQSLFAVARGGMLYGHFFYPLYTLGREQLYRVADSAADLRYRGLGGRLDKKGCTPSLKRRVDWLELHGVIRPDHSFRWHAIRELRNIASHPSVQSLADKALTAS